MKILVFPKEKNDDEEKDNENNK